MAPATQYQARRGRIWLLSTGPAGSGGWAAGGRGGKPGGGGGGGGGG